MGRKCYGLLNVQEDARDWRAEAAEELLDGCVYLAGETMRFGQMPGAPGARPEQTLE